MCSKDLQDIKSETTPSKFKSMKTGRGPLVGNWRETMEPVMCAYKLVKVHFKWFGLTKIVENYAHRVSSCFPVRIILN